MVNAKGQKPLTIGKTKLPGSIGIGVLATKNVTVTGFKVVDAGFDAILVALSSHVLISRNVEMHNGDVGVDLNGSSWSTGFRNVSDYKVGGGYLIADDVRPNSHNVVSYNVASHNPGGCGVIVAGHSTFGVTHNLIAYNLLTYNGTLKSSGGGAGVVIATEVPGETVADNTVLGNTIYGNGLAGVTVHAHLPGQNLNGNRITRNWIGTNNTIGDPIDLSKSPTSMKNVAKPDTRTTGILVGSASSISILISDNYISRNHYGIFLEGVGKGRARDTAQQPLLEGHRAREAGHRVLIPAFPGKAQSAKRKTRSAKRSQQPSAAAPSGSATRVAVCPPHLNRNHPRTK